jgi:hypothetical protein
MIAVPSPGDDDDVEARLREACAVGHRLGRELVAHELLAHHGVECDGVPFGRARVAKQRVPERVIAR